MFVLFKEKRKMKSNKNNRKARFGRLGVVSLMALSLSSQSLFAAGIDLWYLSGPNKDKKLESILDADKKEAVEWLTKLEASKFVEKFSAKPIQFVEALQEALKKSTEKEFKDKLKDAFKAVEAKNFGGDKQKEAYFNLIERALAAKADAEDFEEVAFASAKDREALNITVNKPVKTSKTEVGEQDDSEFKALCDSLKKKQEEFDRVAKVMEELKLQNQKDKQESNQKLANLENLLAEASARQSEQAEQASQFDPAALARNNQQKDASDVLNGLLSNLVADQNKKNAEEEVAPAQNNNQFPFFPQTPRFNNQGNAAAFNQPIPQNNNMLPYMQMFNTPGVQVPVTYDLGVTSGKAELGDAQEIIGVNEMRQSVASSVSPMATIQDLVVAKSRVAADVKRTQVALQNAKDKAGQLDEKLEELKEGGRAALSSSVKQRLAQLKQAVDTKQSYLNQQRQMMQMLSPDQRDQLNNQLMMAQMDLSNAEQQYNQYNAQVEVAIEQANGQIKGLAKQRDQLNAAASKLQSQMASLKEDETAVSQLINNQMQAQMQMMGAGAGTPNINRIQNRGTSGRRAGLGNVVNPQGFVRPSLAK
ncbi:MAG: hypothetical protein EB078_00030 [Proteobacteria bacterium]|nr:hypothetical protein [Pseudomonadota bacterium]NDG25655.1 hypothetical protein [Pseudomonadota bacterium]